MDKLRGTPSPVSFPGHLVSLSDEFAAELLSFGIDLSRSTEHSHSLRLTGGATITRESLTDLVRNLISFLPSAQETSKIDIDGTVYEFSSYESFSNCYFLIYLKQNVRDILSLGFNSSMELFEVECGTPEHPEIAGIRKEELFHADNVWNKRLLSIQNKLPPLDPEARIVRPESVRTTPSLSSLSSACAAGSGLTRTKGPSGGAGAGTAIGRPRSLLLSSQTIIEDCLTSSDGERVIAFSINTNLSLKIFAAKLYHEGLSQGLNPSTFSELQLLCSETLEVIVVLDSTGKVIRENLEYHFVSYAAFKETGLNLTFSLIERACLTISIDGLSPRPILLNLSMDSHSTLKDAATAISTGVRKPGGIIDQSNFFLIFNGKKVATINYQGEFVWIKPDLNKDLTLKALFNTNTITFHLVKEHKFDESMLSLFLGDFSSYEDSHYKITSSHTPPLQTIIIEDKIDISSRFELKLLNSRFVTLKNTQTGIFYELHEMSDAKKDLNTMLTAIAKKLRNHNHEVSFRKRYIDHINANFSVGNTIRDKTGHSYSITELESKKIILKLSEAPSTEFTISIDEAMTLEERKLFATLTY